MAYAFDRIMGVMGRQKKDDGQANTMGRQAPGASQANAAGRPMEAAANPYGQPAAGAASAAAGGADRVRAATTEGALPQGGASGGAPGPTAPQAPEQTPASRGRIFQANAGRVRSPVDLSAMGQQIEAAKGRIKDTADSYVSNAGSYYTGQLPGYVKDSIQGYAGLSDNGADVMTSSASTPAGGLGSEPFPRMPGNDDSGAWRDVNNPVSDASWIEAYTQGPGQVAEFAMPFQTDITNADLIATDAGLDELFRRQGGAEYSAGDAAFDRALLRKNAAFNALRDQTMSQNRDLDKLALSVGEDATKRAQEALKTSYGGWKGAVTGELEAAAKALEGRGGEREGQFDTNLMSQREKDKGKASKYAKDLVSKLRKENPELSEQIKAAAGEGYDPLEFMSVDGLTDADTSWTDFLGDSEAKGFNNVMTLLGKGGPAVGKGQYLGANYGDFVTPNFDSASFADMLLNKAAKMPKPEPKPAKDKAAGKDKPTKTPSGPNAPKPAPTPMPGQVAIDTAGQEPVDIGGAYTPVDPNIVQPVGTQQPGTVALDVESGGESSGGSTANNTGTGKRLPEWWEQTPYNPWPIVTGQMGW